MRNAILLLTTWLGMVAQLSATVVRDTISPTVMTPLVGTACVINQIDKNLIEAIAGTSDLDYIVDTNPNNYASFSSVLSATVAYNPTIAVKNTQYVYDAGTEAGFVIQCVSGTGTNLLTADILQMFWIETYLEGVKQETSKDTESTGGSLLNLNLLTVAANGKTKIAVNTTKQFDEIRFSVSGINADVLSNLKIYYAYAGNNEMHPITQTQYYPNAEVHASSVNGIGNEWTTAIWNWPTAKNNLVATNSENNGVGFGVLSDLLTEPRVTINAKTTIPANTEIGFVVETGTVLAINLLQNTVLTTYDANNNEVESKTIVSVLGLSALGGGKTTVSMVTTQPCQQVKIKFGGLNINVGGSKIFYAYTRSTELELPDVCDLKLNSDITMCSGSSVQLTGVSGIQWSIESQPEGGTANVNATGLVKNIDMPGLYLVKAVKGDCTGYIRIVHTPESGISYNCNQPIVGDNIAIYKPKGGGCLLCLATGTNGNVNNIIDTDLNNYVEYTQGLDLASNTSIIGVQNTINGFKYNASITNPLRVGFIMEATNQFLNVDLLKFFVIKTYLDGKEVESSLVNTNNAIAADLIAGSGNKVRYSFEATQPFDAVVLWTAGLLNINISKFKIYNAFFEPVKDDCYIGDLSSACTEILSSEAHGAMIAYNHTGFGGIANIGAFMTNLEYLIDGDINTSMVINKIAGIGGRATVAVKFNQVVGAGYQAGFIIKDITWVTNVDLISKVGIKTYLNGVETGDQLGTPEVLSLDLIGNGDKVYLSVKPTMAFDEIQLDLTGLADVAVSTDVFGAYIQKDTDGDGIPDCIDKNPCGDDCVIAGINVSCAGDSAYVIIEGERSDRQYVLRHENNSYDFIDGVASFKTDSAGIFNYVITVGTDTIFAEVPVIVHSRQTTWTGLVSNAWNEWANWTDGTPGSCTNVIIPSPKDLEAVADMVRYPILEDLEEQGVIYECNGIHFAPDAEVIHTNRLHYNNVWVEFTQKANQARMLSLPLDSVYTGDFFVPDTLNVNGQEQRPLFEPLLGHVSRTNPSVKQQIWNGYTWTEAFNPVSYVYTKGAGFTNKFINDGFIPNSPDFLIRLPKADTEYCELDEFGEEIEGQIVSIVRMDRVKLFFSYGDTLLTVPVDQAMANDVLVVGNPFACHLDVVKFLQKNDKLESYIKRYDGNNNNPNILYNGELETISITDMGATIAPMESFFVVAKNTLINIVFTPEMMVHGDYDNSILVPQTKAANQDKTRSQLFPASLNAYVLNGEGIIESAEKIGKLQVFTVSGKMILERLDVIAPVRIPLSEGVNIIKVETESESKTFKLVK